MEMGSFCSVLLLGHSNHTVLMFYRTMITTNLQDRMAFISVY